ncbi:hypothetical protein G4G27_23730 [Sphingomonas sp. So64.6b]|uniref:hypothetical protein n=1 Tax=Sphingomonas sp. So64.6b TaxID=2997354 RepID=UPI001600D879|nr:hypothetical protein [Sphingomonas sp. So64.6b]QNA86651.1 hypothetical protein G4G27_23730 [Sphingomonas sp. So64.6b]
MNDIDAMLARLRDAPAHPGLAMIDAAVFDELAARAAPPPPLGARAFSVAAVMALAVGIAGAALPGAPANVTPISPFGAPSALAPSTLLETGE